MHEDIDPLTKEEKAAILALKRLAKRWPKSLWIFSGGTAGSFSVLKKTRDGQRLMSEEGGYGGPGFHHDAIAEQINSQSMEIEGGDW